MGKTLFIFNLMKHFLNKMFRDVSFEFEEKKFMKPSDLKPFEFIWHPVLLTPRMLNQLSQNYLNRLKYVKLKGFDELPALPNVEKFEIIEELVEIRPRPCCFRSCMVCWVLFLMVILYGVGFIAIYYSVKR